MSRKTKTNKKSPGRSRSGAEPAAAPASGDQGVARDPKVAALLSGDDLYERAMKHADTPELARALEQLSPDEAAMFVILVEKQLRKRRLELIGYALALLGFLVGMAFALVLYANREPGEFTGWAFLIPFMVVAAILLVFGRLSRRP